MQGLLEGTSSGRYDIAVGALTVTPDREQVMDFAQPFFATGLGIAIRSDGALNLSPVIRTMTSFGFLQAVATLIGLTLATGVIVWLIERRTNDDFAGGSRGLTSSVWWSTLAMTQRSPVHLGPRTIAGRIVAILWIVASIIALAVFTASVTSVLAAKHLQGSISNVTDLSIARVGTIEGTAAAASLIRRNIGYEHFATVQDGLRALRAQEVDAFVYDKPLLGWHVNQKHSNAIRLLETTFEPQNYAFAVPTGSALRKPVSIGILEATQTEWWNQTRFRYLGPS